MKKCGVTYDDWNCMQSKQFYGKNITTDFFEGYVGVIKIEKVSEPQIWKFNGEDTIVCDSGYQWLTILTKNDYYCITAMLNQKGEILVWYIDLIADQGFDEDGVPYYHDLYLDLIAYPDGTIIEDDMDELEEALSAKDITEEQYHLAIDTSKKLKDDILSDMEAFFTYTYRCLELVD